MQPDKGLIHLAGRAIEKLHPKDRGIGMVFQHYALFPNMTIRQNLAFGLEQPCISFRCRKRPMCGRASFPVDRSNA
ncbi:hypothetical protein [Rhizobium rhizogenes]|uniref:hypothetical protein n=1 Tax=Rhizobium rhizogenes TaxID=359 RepID=UPI0035ABBB72